MAKREMMIYLKTAESCQLDCKHCYTRGSLAPKIFFDPVKSVEFLHQMKEGWPGKIDVMSFSYHGGEPLLAPVKDMMYFYEHTKDLFDVTAYRLQSNLVLNLDDEKMEFLKTVTQHSMGTSWDYDIRFENNRQRELWGKNVKKLVDENFNMTMIVSVTKKLIEDMEPRDIINMAASHGFNYILFERITPTGNAIVNEQIVPSNKDLDDFFMRMYEQTIEDKLYDKIHNLFLSELITSLYNQSAEGCRNRMCEQSVLTINADGSIGGCPNTAPVERYWHIDKGFKGMLWAPERLKAIACEMSRNPICYECPVYDVCRGDCHQLVWQGDVCPAPKSVMIKMKETDDAILEKIIQHPEEEEAVSEAV